MKLLKSLMVIFLIFLSAEIVSAADPPNITYFSPATDPTGLNTSSQAFSVAVNQTVTIRWQINDTYVLNVSDVTGSTYINSTAGYQANPYNVTVTTSNQGGSTSRMWNWSRTIAPSATLISPASSVTDTDANISRTFNISVDRTTNVTWKIDGVQVQYNESAAGLYVNYTNISNIARPGTYTVTAVVNNSNGTGNTITWVWSIPGSSMESPAMSSNITSTGRVLMGRNSTYNFTFNNTGNISRINLTFPITFNFTALEAANISTNMGVPAVNLTPGLGHIEMYNSTGINNSNIYVNITGSLRAPPVAGDYSVTITTNKNTTGNTFNVFVRNASRPFFVSANNSVFTIASETFTDRGTTISLTGTGAANLTLYAPNITGQTNITVGYGATNASAIKVGYRGDIGGITGSNLNIIYVVTLSTVTNPIVAVAPATELESSNLPAAAVTAAISSIVIYYVIRRRTR